MRIRKIVVTIHLWLGVSSGLIILFLGITGCILAFELEIRNFTETYRGVKVEKRAYLPPSYLRAEAEKILDGKKISGIEYRGAGKAAIASYYDIGTYTMIFINPYSGKVLKVKDMNHDFFRKVLMGHYYLWLPPNIGQPVLATATLIFLVMMITGLVLWWPKSKAAAKQRFKIKWNARWRRTNYDLHHVLGFYMTWIGIFLAVSALVMGFEWFAKSVYWVSSGGKTAPKQYPVSDTAKIGAAVNDVADQVWSDLLKTTGKEEGLGIFYPFSANGTLAGNINHRPGTFYNTDYHRYDRYSGKEIIAMGVYQGKYKDAGLADKISRMNYDIHVGAILGLPGKILAFFASLISASLPITGFCIWWGRRKKLSVSEPGS